MDSIHERVADALKNNRFKGEISINKKTLEKYATDESIFYIEPRLVIFPCNNKDVSSAVNVISQFQNPANPVHLTARAAGTGLSGGSLNDSVIVDTTKYFKKIHSITQTESGAIIVIDPGVYYRNLEKQMDKMGVYIPSYPASKNLCTIGGMVANNAAGPDTLRFGQTASFVESMQVVLSDGNEYTIQPLTWDDFQDELKRDDLLGTIYRHVWELLLHNEESILKSRPGTEKNSAGYALWDVVSTTVEEFMKGRGVFNLSHIFSGSQGTIGIITRLTMRAINKPTENSLIVVPVYDLEHLASIIGMLNKHNPINVEISDKLTFVTAMKSPRFFYGPQTGLTYIRSMWYIYHTYMFRFRFRVPEYIIFATVPQDIVHPIEDVTKQLSSDFQSQAWVVKKSIYQNILWNVRCASYTLSKKTSLNMRPAAFLEDMTVPVDKLSVFLSEIKELFVKYDIHVFVHGHGGNGHLHFYPLLDFADPKTAGRITNIAKEFFAVAVKHGGSICGEHNDGIIRTPYLEMIFSDDTLSIFDDLEHVCDPQDIFNPGKKIRPKFDIQKTIRHIN